MRRCSYKAVFNILYKNYFKGAYPTDKIHQADYRFLKVFEELLTLDDNPNEEYQIYICEKEDDSDGERFFDVGLYCSKEDEDYALDLTLWEDLIDAKIKNESKIDDTVALAHILWEITFYGFSSETVKLEKDKMAKLCKRIESGEEKLYPWEG